MTSTEIIYVLQWWITLLFVGASAFPLVLYLFPRFFDRGYIFGKVIGMMLLSYILLVFGELHIVPFTTPTVTFLLVLVAIINVFFLIKNPYLLTRFRRVWKVIVFEELLFLGGLFFWSFVRGTSPDIHGLEKFMDYGFVNSILRSTYFPPKDMWYPPFSINYYYFGHFTTAVLTKLSDLPSEISFNLMLATLFSLTFTGAFSLALNILGSYVVEKFASYQNHKGQNERKGRNNARHTIETTGTKIWNKRNTIFVLVGSFLTAYLTTLGGNLHTIYTFFKPYPNDTPAPFWNLAFSPKTYPNSYWYPNATRFIYHTIHEFPSYSFVVSDLHGHVLDIPFVLLTLGVLFSFFTRYRTLTSKQTLFYSIFSGFLLGVMYMTNAWDGLIYFLLVILLTVFLTAQAEKIADKNKTIFQIIWTKDYFINNAYYLAITFISFIVFSLPFSLFFKPFASQIGLLCAPSFLTKIGHLGPFLFETDHCLHSPLYQLVILHGFWIYWVLGLVFFLFMQGKKGKIYQTDMYVLLLNIVSFLLIIIPEIVYLKDIYPTYYRANTMFKLVYEAFIMFSLTTGYTIMRLLTSVNFRILGKKTSFFFSLLYFPIGAALLTLILIYPYFAISSYYNNLQFYYGLDGTKYLQRLYPSDYEAIKWLNTNIHGQPVILEAQGDSYTDYARVSANTGLPTPLGWTVHEWLWRGSYDPLPERINDIQRIYETNDVNEARALLRKYNVSLVFVGDMERKKYPSMNDNKFLTFGKVIFQKGTTTIYQIHP